MYLVLGFFAHRGSETSLFRPLFAAVGREDRLEVVSGHPVKILHLQELLIVLVNVQD